MPNIPSFSEDMLPRHFPKTKRQLEQNSAGVPVPTLPGVSLILDEENKFPKIEPKKSFQKWKQQHEAIFANNSIEYQGKTDKKQVRFQTNNNNTDGYMNKRKILPTRLNPPVGSPKLELSFYEPPALQVEHGYSQKQYKPQQQHPNAYTGSALTSQANDVAKFNSAVNSKMTHMPQFMHNPTTNRLQNIIDFSQFNRALRSEAIKENWSPNVDRPVCNDQQLQVQKSDLPHMNGYCCQIKQQSCQPTANHYHPCSHELPKTNCLHEQRLPPVIEQDMENSPHQHDASQQTSASDQQLVNPFDLNFEARPTSTLDDDTLMGIMEEQQHHILMQQNQILMQQKQILMQQNQIFILQHQVEKLLLRNGTTENQSPTANRQLPSSPICDKKTTSPGVMSNALAMRNNGSPRPSPNGIKNRTSIGVMTSFVGNLNDAMPNGIRQMNEKFTSTTKLTSDRGGIGSGEQSYKDSMLDKINEVIRNSPAVVDYRQANGTNRRMSPSKPTDINIAAQTLIYETSSTSHMNDQKTADRSFALYMLGMKYCPQDDQSGANQRDSNHNDNFGNSKRPSSNTDGNDHIAVDIPPDAYDYLIRHGLLKK